MRFNKIIKMHKEKMKMDEEHICVLCKKIFIGYGNNAQPLKEGLCCDDCNIKVIETRLKLKNE
jgi:hypothetical protein